MKLLAKKIYFKIFGYRFERNFLELFFNLITPNYFKTILAILYWKKLDFKLSEEEANSHKSKAEKIFKNITINNNNISRILEFGGSYGINLEPFLEKFTDIEVISIDTNNSVKRLEKKYENYKGIIGSDNILRDIPSLKYDIAFCCSVLDHIPDEKKVISIIQQLIRIAKKVYLFEPFLEGVCGDVSYFYRIQIEEKYKLKYKIEDNYKKFAKNSYLWNYDLYLENLNLPFKKNSFKLHKSSLGPFYKCYEIN